MEFADEALLAKMEGNKEASISLFERAFSLEKEPVPLHLLEHALDNLNFVKKYSTEIHRNRQKFTEILRYSNSG